MNIASYIDHTILRPAATAADVQQVCYEAIQWRFASVCIPPYYVSDAREQLPHWCKVTTVVGFPFGYSVTSAKMQEIIDAVIDGADELDMVHNIAALKNNDWYKLEEEIDAMTKVTEKAGKTLKVIVESGLLTDEELIKCCELYKNYPVQYLKTSTGYAETGASVHAVKLMRAHLPEHILIKASGGIRTFNFAKELIDAGASRLGSSASVQIVNESSEL